MRVFFTGITGLFGKYFLEARSQHAQHDVFGTSRTLHELPDTLGHNRPDFYQALPFENLAAYEKALDQFRPDWIIHAGGEGHLDRAEQDPSQTEFTNYTFQLWLLAQAETRGCKIIQFSSSAVYDGKQAPYTEQSAFGPLQVYGKLKAKVDQATRQSGAHWVIVRPSVTYGWNFSFARSNLFTHFLPLLQARRKVKVVTDVRECPLYAGDAARALWAIVESNFQGEINLAGGDPPSSGISRFEFVRTLARTFECDLNLIEPARISDFSSLAARPLDCRFDPSKMGTALGLKPLPTEGGLLTLRKEGFQDDPLSNK